MQVTFNSRFWVTIVQNFDEIRGPLGEPSLKDFCDLELPLIIETISQNNTESLMVQNYQVVFFRGKLRPLYSLYLVVEAQEIIVVKVEIDYNFPFE